MTPQSDSDKTDSSAPPVRRPTLFYITVFVAFGLLGAAVLALQQ